MAEGTITHLLAAWSQGDREALDRLAPLVYGELRRLAFNYLRRERPGHTIETGTLVHEAFLRLVDQRQVSWQNRAHFFGIAALMMRRVLVEQARSRQSARRGEGALHVSLDAAAEIGVVEAPEVLALAEALRQLSESYPQAAEVVELRFFGGLDEREIGEVLGISVPTVKRRWRMARAWLHRQLAGPDRHEP
jgi:RNA polymerase sigma factor (TIGR02999 family)